MWPKTGGASYQQSCYETGYHRWGAMHFMTEERDIVTQVCRGCGEFKTTRLTVKNNRISSQTLPHKKVESAPNSTETVPKDPI